MMIVRPVQANDLNDLYELSLKTGAGLTTFPSDKRALQNKIDVSLKAFAQEPNPKEKREYLLVMEDTAIDKVVGTSGISTGVGLDKPFYTYRILHITQECRALGKRVDTQLLQMANDYVGASEVMTLFLHPDYRTGHNGKLLSKARYLLIAAHENRFSDTIISEIRGWVDENNKSPFWQAIGKPFFQMEYEEADNVSGSGNSQFISDLMPRFPIYTTLLSKKAQEVIGKPHDMARGAIKLLELEGFRKVGSVDIFDGGPTFMAHRDLIWTVSESKKGTIAGVVDGSSSKSLTMVANPSIENFKVALTNVVETESGDWLPAIAAKELDIEAGDTIIFAPLRLHHEEDR